MNALFLTQANSLAMFYDLMQALHGSLRVDRAGFLVAERNFFERFQAQHPELEGGSITVLKEWEIVLRAGTGEPDLERLRAYEQRLGDPTFWSAIVSDRRVYLGPLSTLRQDYRPRFDHGRMLRILEEGLLAVERWFDEVRPDAVFSFLCVTFAEYLVYLVARERGIPILNLRPTRIENYVTFAPTVFEPSETIQAAFAEEQYVTIEDETRREARDYVRRARGGAAKYEGVIPVSRRPPRLKSLRANLAERLMEFVRTEYAFHFQGLKHDNHLVDPLSVALHRRLLNPARARAVNRQFERRYVRLADLPALSYAFFPLHTEPEISLLVHSRAYLNQIEVIRTLAQSLPVGWSLLVKEHPASVGKRPVNYYAKLLEIPNVRLADPGLPSTALIEHARLVATIAGSIGFEAALLGKPVIIFGHTPYEMLPAGLVRQVSALPRLAHDIQGLLRDYAYDEQALVNYVAATLRHSTRCNLYSGLLGREGVYAPQAGSDGGQGDIDRLSQLAVKTLAGLAAPA
jgi:hypothetical protein